MSLRKSALSGMYWTFIQQMSAQGIGFIISIVLARILLPEEFGLIALLGVFIAIGNTLVNSGLGLSLIRTKEVDDDDYSTVFYFNLGISLLVYAIVYFTAPFIANFYNQPPLTDIARVYSLTFVISSLSVVQNTRLNKAMNFKQLTIISIPSLIISGATGVILALNNFGVWSLVWSAIIKEAAHTLQLWWYSPWKPLLRFKTEKIKQHFKFGYKMTIAGVVDTLFKDIYTIVIGKFFDPMQVGFYNRAKTFSQLPINSLGNVLNKVTFPLFSKIQDDNEKLKNAYKKVMQMSVFLVAPTLLFMAVLATPLFRFLLTEKWLPAVPYFQILCVAGMLHPINSYNLNILTVKGKSDLYLKLSIIKKILILTVVIVVINWGIYGLLFGQLFISITGMFFNGYFSGRLINYPIFSQLKDISLLLVISFISAGLIYYIDKVFLINYPDIIRLLSGATLGITNYFLLSLLFKLAPYFELKSILLKKK